MNNMSYFFSKGLTLEKASRYTPLVSRCLISPFCADRLHPHAQTHIIIPRNELKQKSNAMILIECFNLISVHNRCL